MGYRVDVVGHVDVRPKLNDAEYGYLMAFAESSRWDRPEGPFYVPMGPPFAAERMPPPEERRSGLAPGQPGSWCSWAPSCQGRCLSVYDPTTFKEGRLYSLTEWLSYLVDAFLRPGALASFDDSVPDFAGFTFDHVVSGAVAAHRSDTGELWLVRADNNVVTHETIRAAINPWEEWDDDLS
jgi:hypothetical protein